MLAAGLQMAAYRALFRCRGDGLSPEVRLQLFGAVGEEQRAAQGDDGEPGQQGGDGGEAAGAFVQHRTTGAAAAAPRKPTKKRIEYDAGAQFGEI